MTSYENILINIFTNAAFKITGAVDIHTHKYSYNLSYFASVIAEEELAKLVILPFAQELGELEVVIKDRKGAYFSHGIKQKLFTNFGLQNRSYEEIEKIKQECLYVGVREDLTPILKVISETQSLEEVKHAVLLFTRFYSLHYARKDFSENFKKGLLHLMSIVKGCVLENLPKIDELIIEEGEKLKQKSSEEMTEYMIEHLLRNPYELIAMFKAVFKEHYKERLAEVKHLDYKELESWLEKTTI